MAARVGSSSTGSFANRDVQAGAKDKPPLASASDATIGLPSDDSHHRPRLSSDSTVRSCRAGRTALDCASVAPMSIVARF
jgi:hypothetical protein